MTADMSGKADRAGARMAARNRFHAPRAPDRAARLKSALKANMAKRKAQAKARQAGAHRTSGAGRTDA
jgi:hypothetical protein